MSVGDNLRSWRQKRELTQPVLAERAGIEQSYLSKIENDRSSPSEAVVQRLAEALGIESAVLTETAAGESSGRSAGLAVAGAALFLVGSIFGAVAMQFSQPNPLNPGTEEIRHAEGLAPDGLNAVTTEVIGGYVVRISGNARSHAAAMQYASRLLREGVYGRHLHYLSEKDGKFVIDISNRPRRRE